MTEFGVAMQVGRSIFLGGSAINAHIISGWSPMVPQNCVTLPTPKRLDLQATATKFGMVTLTHVRTGVVCFSGSSTPHPKGAGPQRSQFFGPIPTPKRSDPEP